MLGKSLSASVLTLCAQGGLSSEAKTSVQLSRMYMYIHMCTTYITLCDEGCVNEYRRATIIPVPGVRVGRVWRGRW